MAEDDSESFTKYRIAPYVRHLCISYAHLRVSKQGLKEARGYWGKGDIKGVIRFVARTYNVPINNLKVAFGIKKYSNNFAGAFIPGHFLEPWKLFFSFFSRRNLGWYI